MFCRSLLVISRLNVKTSNISSRCVVASCNNHFLFSYQQHNRYLTQNISNMQPPSRTRRFFRWFIGKSEPIQATTSTTLSLKPPAPPLPPEPPSPPLPPKPPSPPLTTMQRVKRFLALAPMLERFLLRSHIINDEDAARLISKTAAVTIYAFICVTALGTYGVDTKPLLAGIGITGFTVGFALKEVATNFISGVFLVINKPFVRGCRIQIHGGGGGIEGIVHYIDVRYVHLKTKDRGIVMIPSSVVYTNPFTVFPADDEANVGFIDMTKPPTDDPTKPAEPPSSPPPVSDISSKKEKKLKMNFDREPAGLFKKTPLNEKL